MSGSNANRANPILLAIVGFLVGGIGGYLIGQGQGGGQPLSANTLPSASSTVNCPHTLDAEDEYILAGFRCPNTPDTQAALLTCHCITAHSIMDRVKSELAAGKTGEEIRAEIQAEYGDRLKFAGQ